MTKPKPEPKSEELEGRGNAALSASGSLNPMETAMCRYTISFTDDRRLRVEAADESSAVIRAVEILAHDPAQAVRSIDELVSIESEAD